MQFISGLAAAIDRCAANEGVNETCIHGLCLYRGKCDTPRQPSVYKPSICAVAQGQKRIHLGERTYTYDPDNYLLNSLTLPLEAEVSGTSSQYSYLGLSLEVDTHMVSQLMLQMDLYQEFRKEEKGLEIVSSSPLTEQLKQNLIKLIGLTANPMDRDILCEGVKKEIFYEVLKGPHGGLLSNCVRNHNGANRIAPVVHYLEENFNRSLDIETIARVAQMSSSSLHEQFRSITSLSPMQFVKNLRLHKARTLLLSGAKASETCYSVGYNSPSQFSREFKRMFGCSPTEIYSASES